MRLITTKDTNNPPTSLSNAKSEQERIAINQDLDSISDTIYKGGKITINDTNDAYHGEEEYEVRYQSSEWCHHRGKNFDLNRKMPKNLHRLGRDDEDISGPGNSLLVEQGEID